MKITQKYPEVDYGPLAWLIGAWSGDRGVDIAPNSDGTEENLYHDTIAVEEAGDLDNAEKQKISMVRYVQVVRRKSNDEVFHDQTGYWMWDARNKVVMHSVAIPRGLCLLAGGKANADYDAVGRVEIEVAAREGDPDWGIVQSPFLRDEARTVAFKMSLVVDKDKLVFSETTSLKIYGRDFEHTDNNELKRVK